MGCGASSLKGDDVSNVNSQPVQEPTPIKKVQTNFSTIDYEQDARTRRMTEYAPHETIQKKSLSRDPNPRTVSGASGASGDRNPSEPGASFPHEGRPTAADPTKDHDDAPAPLKPYQTFDGGDWDADQPHAPPAPHVNGVSDPTSAAAKDNFATSNDPANPHNQETRQDRTELAPEASSAAPGADDKDKDKGGDRKKSWLGQKYAGFQAAKAGKGPSDEDIKKFTGRDKAELNEWAQGRAGVGGQQPAGAGTESMLAAGAPYTST